MTLYMQYAIPPIKKKIDPYKIPPQKNTEDNFMRSDNKVY